MAKALTLAGGSDFPYFEWKPWLKRVHAVALQLSEFIAMPGPRDQFDLPSAPLPMPYMPLGRAVEVSETVDGQRARPPFRIEALQIADDLLTDC